MSVMVLNLEGFGNVRKTLGSTAIRMGSHGVNVCECLGVSDAKTPAAIDGMFDAIDDFVRRAYFWNCAAYELRYHEKCLPTDTEWRMICAKGGIVSKARLFHTLSCIDYNTDICDYMDAEVYERSPWHDDFEAWHAEVEALIAAVAESIAWEKADEEGCKWGE